MKSKLLIVAAAALAAGACSSPTSLQMEGELRDRLLGVGREYTAAVENAPVIAVSRAPSAVEADLTPQRQAELDKLSGPESYGPEHFDLGPDLTGQTHSPTVQMSLRTVIHKTLQNNLNLRIARMVPSIDDQQITQAEAVFDAVFFANVDYQKLDTPRFASVGAIGFLGNDLRSTNTSVQAGVRKLLATGAQVSAQYTLNYQHSTPSSFAVKSIYTPSVMLTIEQPLLRNFGSDVNRAQIELARSTKRQDLEDLRNQLLQACLTAERAYWDLVFARQQLQIRVRLLERTIRDREHIKQREIIDATPQAITQANSTVESRRADVIRARQAVRQASDNLKRLMNDEDLPLSGETLIAPLDVPVDAPVQLSLLDGVTNALQHRPELRSALLQIDDASLRQRVADNQRLPLLNLSASVRANGLDQDPAFIGDLNYIDYIIGAQFEAPLGNRAAEAVYEQRRIERRAAVINYRNQAQQAVLEVKNAMREVFTTYELIGAERSARRAAAENVRALEAQETAGAAMTPDFLDLKLRRQEALATAELREAQAIADYNVAIANYYLAMGTLLERNQVEFEPQGK